MGIGFFFKTMAFKSDDGAETCSSPGGTGEAYCKKADLSSPDPCTNLNACHVAGLEPNLGAQDDSVCVYSAASTLPFSSYVLFIIQAINSPTLFVLFTAIENSFLR